MAMHGCVSLTLSLSLDPHAPACFGQPKPELHAPTRHQIDQPELDEAVHRALLMPDEVVQLAAYAVLMREAVIKAGEHPALLDG